MSRAAMKLALEVMQNQGDVSVDEWIAAEKALQEALAKQPAQQEPVAWISEPRFDELRQGFPVMTTLTKHKAFEDDVAFYTSPPPQRTWVGLTDSERGKVYADWRWSDGRTSNLALCEAIEAKLKEKNT